MNQYTSTPPHCWFFFPPSILILRMSLHNLPQNKSQPWIWQCGYEERSLISGWWLFGSSTQERRGFAVWRDAAPNYPNCYILVRNLTWLFLKCSVNPAPPPSPPLPPPFPSKHPPLPWGYGASAKFVLQCVVTLQWQCSNIPILFQNKLPAVSH